MSSRYFNPPKPRFFAHRGAAAWAPENTLIAFEKAAAHTNYIETDTWVSADGVPVLHHDESALRTCGRDIKIAESTFEQLQTLDAGAKFFQNDQFPFAQQGITIPSLEDVLNQFPEHFFNIEIKDPKEGAVEKVLETLDKCHALDRVMLAAEDDDIMKNIRKLKPSYLPTSVSHGEALGFVHWFMKGAPKGEYTCEAKAFQIPYEWQGKNLGSPEIISAIHSLGCEVHYWTVNDKKIMQRLIDAGADGIVSDYPVL